MRSGDGALIVVALTVVEIFGGLSLILHALLFAVQVLLVVRLVQARRVSRSRR